MFIIGLLLSLFIGVVLGLVGGGGSILTVPLVHYVFGESMLLATTYSLFIVAVSSGFGVLQRLKSDSIDFKNGIIFAIPSMLTAFTIRLLVMPQFPLTFAINDFELSRDFVISILLVVVMFYTAIKTLIERKKRAATHSISNITIVLFGVLTGLLSGFIGAGGGFIIVPILLRLGLTMKKAVGTSMLIISIQSFVALIGDFFNPEVYEGDGINMNLIVALTGITIVGVFIGTYLQKFLSGKILRKVFSLLLIVVAAVITIEFIYNT
jgi:uncharacterized membrane protein YfcA